MFIVGIRGSEYCLIKITSAGIFIYGIAVNPRPTRRKSRVAEFVAVFNGINLGGIGIVVRPFGVAFINLIYTRNGRNAIVGISNIVRVAYYGGYGIARDRAFFIEKNGNGLIGRGRFGNGGIAVSHAERNGKVVACHNALSIIRKSRNCDELPAFLFAVINIYTIYFNGDLLRGNGIRYDLFFVRYLVEYLISFRGNFGGIIACVFNRCIFDFRVYAARIYRSEDGSFAVICELREGIESNVGFRFKF